MPPPPRDLHRRCGSLVRLEPPLRQWPASWLRASVSLCVSLCLCVSVSLCVVGFAVSRVCYRLVCHLRRGRPRRLPVHPCSSSHFSCRRDAGGRVCGRRSGRWSTIFHLLGVAPPLRRATSAGSSAGASRLKRRAIGRPVAVAVVFHRWLSVPHLRPMRRVICVKPPAGHCLCRRFGMSPRRSPPRLPPVAC